MLAPLSFIFAALAASVVAQDQAPILYDAEHNATDITGTWTTGAGAVLTGPGFANPVNYSFNYPATTGWSYSFSEDGFFEEAGYRFTSNASDPHCIVGVVLWQHGTYSLLHNGSIVLTPIAADGRQQVQDPCAAISNQIIQWNTTVLFQSWRIFALPGGGFHLHLFDFSGAPLAPMSLAFKPPRMLPTSQLTNINSTTQPPAPKLGPGNRKRQGLVLEARNDAPRTASVVAAAGLAGLAGVGALLLISL